MNENPTMLLLISLLQVRLARMGYWSSVVAIPGERSEISTNIAGSIEMIFGLMVAPQIPIHVPLVPFLGLVATPEEIEVLAESVVDSIESQMTPSSPFQWWLSPIGRN
jgi:hypothetical protein